MLMRFSHASDRAVSPIVGTLLMTLTVLAMVPSLMMLKNTIGEDYENGTQGARAAAEKARANAATTAAAIPLAKGNKSAIVVATLAAREGAAARSQEIAAAATAVAGLAAQEQAAVAAEVAAHDLAQGHADLLPGARSETQTALSFAACIPPPASPPAPGCPPEPRAYQAYTRWYRDWACTYAPLSPTLTCIK